MSKPKSSLGTVVGLAKFEAVNNPKVLVALALGSCVALMLYDYKARVAGLAHIMLPSRGGSRVSLTPGKFADTALDALLKAMVRRGARRNGIVAKLVGGAHMFDNGKEERDSPSADIGHRNVRKVKQLLKEKRIKLRAEDTGGTYARSVKFYSESGKVLVSSAKGEIKEL